MPSFKQSKILPYPANKLYELVMDIEKYPQFLPWCKQAKITKISSDSELEAILLIDFKNFLEKYTSRVTHGKTVENSYFVDVAAIQGPFKKLINKWQLEDLDDKKCRIEFFIDFEFNSIFLEKIAGAIFKKATDKMMDAFEKRAQEIL